MHDAGKRAAAGAAKLLTELAPLLSGMAAAHRRLALQYLSLHKATAKLGYITTSLLAGVIASGFCTADTREAAEDDSRYTTIFYFLISGLWALPSCCSVSHAGCSSVNESQAFGFTNSHVPFHISAKIDCEGPGDSWRLPLASAQLMPGRQLKMVAACMEYILRIYTSRLEPASTDRSTEHQPFFGQKEIKVTALKGDNGHLGGEPSHPVTICAMLCENMLVIIGQPMERSRRRCDAHSNVLQDQGNWWDWARRRGHHWS